MRLFLLLFLFISCTAPQADTASGTVVRIADGDTFTLLTPQNRQVRVRLFGVDAPERAQPFGNVAKQKLAALVFRKPVQLQVRDKDRYGRTVAVVFTTSGQNVNEEMLRAGLVWQYTAYDHSERWHALQQSARQKGAGLWTDAHPTPPWLWRKNKRAAAAGR